MSGEASQTDAAIEALNAILKPLGTHLRHYMPVHRDATIAVMRDILVAERERAARIAERDVDWTRFGKGEVHEPWENGPDDARDYRAGIIAGRSIAAAIRGGSQ